MNPYRDGPLRVYIRREPDKMPNWMKWLLASPLIFFAISCAVAGMVK